MKWLVWVALGLGGCESVLGCNAPGEVEYNCQPIATGSPGCIGGPTYFDDGKRITADTEQTFPANCGASLPVCDNFHPGAQFAQCVQSGTSFEWEILQ